MRALVLRFLNSPKVWLLAGLCTLIVRAVLVIWQAEGSEIYGAARPSPKMFEELWLVAAVCGAMALVQWIRPARARTSIHVKEARRES